MIDLNDQAKGVYFVKVITESGQSIHKLVLE
ncbi:MAG: T9SS type A sorting domain-containing protein [Crocinitomicaceae bacterium]|nr:T9SS type A sorting domain-containing protein [Crocinitomicaceae bacterium]